MHHDDQLIHDLYTEICRIPLIDPHSHINPLMPASKSLDDILGYHYYTELAHSTGMSKEPLDPSYPQRERVRHILRHMTKFDNTAQYSWFLRIARTFLGYEGDRVTEADCDWLWDAAEKKMAQPDWEEQVLRQSNIEKVFLTNEFDDPLEGFDTNRYVPCLRLDTLVFNLHQREVWTRLAKVTGVEVRGSETIKQAVRSVFERFKKHGAKACAISLPPNFQVLPPVSDESLDYEVMGLNAEHPIWQQSRSTALFALMAMMCREFDLPFDLMIGVNRNVYENGVYQGRDLFDQLTSLILYADIFNAFPDVKFCVSVLSSNQNQELASYSWIFPNVYTSGHWWYSNIPAYIENDLRARLQAVPKTKQIGYYSDMYKLEFGLPKFNMYRRILARVLAEDFIKTRIYTETQAVELARLLLRDNVKQIFSVD